MRQPNFRRGRGRGSARRPSGRNQTFDSNGPNVKVRGTAPQILEKYLALARDAAASGDRIMAENFYQHAEHYHRIIVGNGAAPEREHGPKGGNGRLDEEDDLQVDRSDGAARQKSAGNQAAESVEPGDGADTAEEDQPSA